MAKRRRLRTGERELAAPPFQCIKEIDQERNWLTKEESEAFAGENSAYYLAKWKDRPESFFKGWNWAAAFFTVEWLAYRKMYFISAILHPGILAGLGMRRVPPFVPFYLVFSRFLDEWPAVIASFLVAKFVIGGVYGNIWYRKAALQTLEKSFKLHENEADHMHYMKRKGGTNVAAAVIAAIVQVIGVILFAFYL